jgi:hypothetical protein
VAILRKPPNDQFDGMIGPGQLLAWVQGSCPFLFSTEPPPAGRLADLAVGPEGFRAVLAAGPSLIGAKPGSETRDDYLALCLAAHHATVGSYVPTDVDTKIRGELWRRAQGETLRRRWRLACLSRTWATAGVSTRVETTSVGPVSGHDGEWLSVACGAFGAAVLAKDAQVADEALHWIRSELEREARAFTSACANAKSTADWLAVIRLAWILTHNAGDVDQGLSYWPADERLAAARRELAALAHEQPERFAGTYLRAKAVYQLVAAEGHRNYPLRAVKALRRDASLLLPLGPCLEAWGRTIATSPHLSDGDRAEVLEALLSGVLKVKGQFGYQRAVVGLATCKGGLSGLTKRLPAAAMRGLDDLGMRKQLTISEEAFAAALAKQVKPRLAEPLVVQ